MYAAEHKERGTPFNKLLLQEMERANAQINTYTRE
jgi:hypothetical protein